MEYQGYRVKIAGVEIPNMLIASGTYSFKKSKRLIKKYTDGNGTDHYDYYKAKKALISFSIRARTLEEQKSIKNIFTQQDNVPVVYWDDYDCEYKAGVFKMSEPIVKHSNAVGTNIMYQPTPIVLEEY